MRKLNRKLLFLLLTAFLLANATVVYAYTMHHTQDLVNTFLPARVDSEVVESFDGNAKSEIKIQNTSNVEAYLRMKIITYWQDSKGNIVAIPPRRLLPPSTERIGSCEMGTITTSIPSPQVPPPPTTCLQRLSR